MNSVIFWWVLAGAAVGLELLTGTFYLLMLALGFAGAAIAAHFWIPLAFQFAIASVVGGGAVVIWHFKQLTRKPLTTEQNSDVHLDIGSTIDVAAWSASGTARVLHRGAEWSARHSASGLQGSDTFASGLHRITAVEGNTLVLVKI